MARNKDSGQLLAIPTNIHTLLTGGAIAWERIEFRESWQPEESLKTITAFANDIGNRGGGYIVIGVADDNGRPKFPLKGLSPAEIAEIRQDVLNKCKLIEPEYLPAVALADYDDHTRLLVVSCPGGDNRPYRSPAALPPAVASEKGKADSSGKSVYWIRKLTGTDQGCTALPLRN